MDYFLTWYATKSWSLTDFSTSHFNAGIALLKAGASADEWRVFMYGA